MVIGLSEDIQVTAVVMANYEKYSSMLKDFQILGSISYPSTQWIDLGTYTAEPRLGEQHFNITQPANVHTRYLKIKFLTHYLDEALCTLSQIKVHGMTVIASLKDEVEMSGRDLKDILNDLQNTGEIEEIFQKENISDSERSSKTSDEVKPHGAELLSDNNASTSLFLANSTSVDELNSTSAGSEILYDALHKNDSLSADQSTSLTSSLTDNALAIDSLKDTERSEKAFDISPAENTTSTIDSNVTRPNCSMPSNEDSPVKGDNEYISFIDEQGNVVDTLTFNSTEWSIINKALVQSNLNKDFLINAYKKIKELFVDPLSQKLQILQLESFIHLNRKESSNKVVSTDDVSVQSNQTITGGHDSQFADNSTSVEIHETVGNGSVSLQEDANPEREISLTNVALNSLANATAVEGGEGEDQGHSKHFEQKKSTDKSTALSLSTQIDSNLSENNSNVDADSMKNMNLESAIPVENTKVEPPQIDSTNLTDIPIVAGNSLNSLENTTESAGYVQYISSVSVIASVNISDGLPTTNSSEGNIDRSVSITTNESEAAPTKEDSAENYNTYDSSTNSNKPAVIKTLAAGGSINSINSLASAAPHFPRNNDITLAAKLSGTTGESNTPPASASATGSNTPASGFKSDIRAFNSSLTPLSLNCFEQLKFVDFQVKFIF